MRFLRRFVASAVVPAVASVALRLSPEHLALPVGWAATRRAARHFGQLACRSQIAGDGPRPGFALLAGFFTTASSLIRPWQLGQVRSAEPDLGPRPKRMYAAKVQPTGDSRAVRRRMRLKMSDRWLPFPVNVRSL